MAVFNYHSSDDVYYITCFTLGTNFDKDIAEYIGISLEEYRGILKLYNSSPGDNGEYYFNNPEDIEECVNYLNEKYTVILNLIGV